LTNGVFPDLNGATNLWTTNKYDGVTFPRPSVKVFKSPDGQ